MRRVKKQSDLSLSLNVLKGAMVAVSFSLVFILAFALVIKFFNVPDVAITPVNQVLKTISIFLGCLFALKNFPNRGLITGGLIGIVYTVIAFLIFSLLGQTFNLNLTLLNDVAFALIVGALSGIFLVNKKMRVA